MRAFSYAWSLPVTLQSWYSLIWRSRKAHATRRLHGSIFYRTDLWAIEVLHRGNKDFRLFCFYDLNVGPMTFIYDLDPYSMEIHRMCKYELLTSSSPESSSPSLVSLKCTSINQILILRPENLTSCFVVK